MGWYDSCCCRAYVQMMDMKEGLNSMRRGTVHKKCEYHCEVCWAQSKGFALHGYAFNFSWHNCPLRNIYSKSDDKEYHKLRCIQTIYENCNVSISKVCLQELSEAFDALVSWRNFKMVFVGREDNGGDRHVLRLEHKMTPPADPVVDLSRL